MAGRVLVYWRCESRIHTDRGNHRPILSPLVGQGRFSSPHVLPKGRSMTSLVALAQYRAGGVRNCGGYVLECGDGSLYVGKSRNLDQRLQQHVRGGGRASSVFLPQHGGPTRVVELYFCQTEVQATAWETATLHALRDTVSPSRAVGGFQWPNQVSTSSSIVG